MSKDRENILKTVMHYCSDKMKNTTYWEANHQGDPHCIVWNGANSELVKIENQKLEKKNKTNDNWGGAKQW